MTVADVDESSSAHRAARRQPSFVALGFVALSIPSVAYLVHSGVQTVHPWVPLAFLAAFVLADSLMLTVEIRSHTVMCSASEAVLVLALVQVGGFWTALAWAAATGVISIRDRLPASKIAANVAVVVVQVGVSLFVLDTLPVGSLDAPITWSSYLSPSSSGPRSAWAPWSRRSR